MTITSIQIKLLLSYEVKCRQGIQGLLRLFKDLNFFYRIANIGREEIKHLRLIP